MQQPQRGTTELHFVLALSFIEPMHPFRIGKHEKEVGVCLTTICPHCEQLSRFMLREISAALNVFGQHLFSIDANYQIVCGKCGFRKDLNTEEFSDARAAMRLFFQLETQQIELRRYIEDLEALNFPTFRALREEAASWTCGTCKERVPAALNACWNCNSPRPGLENPSAPENGALPPLPYAVIKPVNPWD